MIKIEITVSETDKLSFHTSTDGVGRITEVEKLVAAGLQEVIGNYIHDVFLLSAQKQETPDDPDQKGCD